MAIVLNNAGTELEQKKVLETLIVHHVFIVVKGVIPLIVAGSRITGDGSGNLNLQIKLTLNILTIQDPSKLGYLKTSNFVLQEHRKKNQKGKWYLDSACSRHMIGDKQLFKSVTKLDGETVTFGDKSKGNVIRVGKVPLSSTCDVDEVYLVDKLGYNLLSTSQLCDNDYEVCFKKHDWFIEDEPSKIILSRNRDRNVYTIRNLDNLGDQICLTSMIDDPWVWHRKLGHASMHTIQKLSKHVLVIGLPKLDFSKDHICDACQLGKQTRSSFKFKNIVSTSKPLQLLHMDLFGLTRTASISGRKYAFVIVDDFSRFTWVMFLSHKDDALKIFEVFCKKVQREKGYYISTIRSDHGGEFESRDFENFCNDQGISHDFSSPRSPQQNVVVERKNRTLQDMARTMIVENSLPHHFWAEAVSTACHIINRCLIQPILKKTPYELWNGKKPNINYFHPFGCKCFIHNNGKDNLVKFDPKSDEGDPQNGITTRRSQKNKSHVALISQLEPKKVDEALKDTHWISAMKEELDQFERNKSPKGIFIIQTKYTKELIKKFGMKNAKSIGTPVSPTTMLDEDSNEKKVDETMYRGMIGSLLYLTAIRSDIIFSLCKCAKFQSAPKESHLTAVKRIIRYRIGTSELRLWYDRSNNFALRGFSYADFAADKIDRKSTSGTCQLFGNALVSWHSKKQNCVVLSTTKAEYLAVGSCCTQHLFSLFDTIGNSFYEELVRMFYANLFVNDKDDLESMVLGTRIVLNSYQFEKIFFAKFSGFDVFVQNSWPKDFEVSYEEAKTFLSDNPPDISPKNL
ncbi:uncharacterized protein LOC142175799 [Nicotiana tabacum]|uniref:Uncharacterized protein LOC142175799 n=1 Tax=Nicotiana tabacum TaxID=4097 RepID=A0AC58TNU2_TOBAC